MAHGADTEELLRRIANCKYGILNVSFLNITSLPELPSGLQELHCYNTPLTSLPELPSELQQLYCYNTQITILPKLPSGLQVLSCYNTQITSLPDLPSGLKALYCQYNQLTALPELPSGLKGLFCDNCPLILQRGEGESIHDYNLRWRAWREEKASKARTLVRTEAIKEDLMAEVWHPRRVEKMLELEQEAF
jgi:Leucine-rich repeat (LRR) protein